MPEEGRIPIWDPPPPTAMSWAPVPALVAIALVLAALGYCDLAGWLAALGALAGLVNLYFSTGSTLRTAQGDPAVGGGGLPPDPPPPTMLKSTAFKGLATAFTASAAVSAFADCCDVALWLLVLALLTSVPPLFLGKPKQAIKARSS